MIDIAQIDKTKLDELSVDQLRDLTRALLARTDQDGREIVLRDAKIDKLTFEIAQLRRMKFDRSSEQLSAEQRALFDEAVDGDIAAIDEQLAALNGMQPAKPEDEKKQPKRAPLPDRLPRHDVYHEPDSTTCGCGQAMKRIGEDVSEKLDYTPGVFTVERQVVLRVVPNVGAGADAAGSDRQRYPDGRATGPCAGGQACRSPAVVPPGDDLRPRGAGDPARHAGRVGRPVRGATGAGG